ncbi:MAG: hypothetical protein K0Q72_2916, partial [Armatimonadetes bacterium]|nr:hypothetical protein [Armatimonadota bacterium]
MATDERRRRRDTGRALADELTALQRSYLMAQVEGVATLADAARDFLNRIADEEPLSNAATWGDAIRDTPDTVIDATLDASTRLSEIPKRMAETFRSELKSDRPARTRSAGRRAGSTPEHEIVAEARAHLRGIPGAAALLGGLVDNVSLRTGFERETVRTVILRHFVSNGTVVRDRPAPGGEEEAGDPALARMERTLTVLGYTDLRRDCALAAFPGL